MSSKINLYARTFISSFLILDFFIVSLTGLGLAQAPDKSIIKETHWTFLGFPQPKLEKLHNLSGFIMIGLIILHFSLNYSMYLNELKLSFKNKFKSKSQ